MTNNAIDDLAKTVRAAYSLTRSLYETAKAGYPVVYVIPKLYDGKQGVETDDGVCLEKDIPPLWPKLAKKFVTLEIDPEAYISIQFDARDIAHRPPEPNHLFSEQCLKHWEKFKHAKGDEIRTLLDVNKIVFEQNVSYLEQQGIKKLDAVIQSLLDFNLSISMLFRYCYAYRAFMATRMIEFKEIAKAFKHKAAVQFHFFKNEYTAHWTHLLPETFVKSAPELYKQFYALRQGARCGTAS